MNHIVTPSLRIGRSVFASSMDAMIVVLCLTVYSVVLYGVRPLFLTLIAIGTAVLCEAICLLWMKRPLITLADGTAILSGSLIAMLMSPITPAWVTILAVAFATLLVKMPFGGTGRNLFNPVAAGVAFVTLCFPDKVLVYPNPDQGQFLLWETSSIITQTTVADALQHGGASFETPLNLLFGNTPGPIGATAILVLLAGLVFLAFRRTVSLASFGAYIATCAVIAFLFPRSAADRLTGLLLELSAGSLLFGGIFLLNDPTTSPRHTTGRVVYGIVVGALVMAFRHFGRFPDGVCFAVLLANPFASVIDRWTWIARRFVEKRWLHRE